MIAYDIDDRHPRTTRIVQIRHTIRQARPKMQQGASRFLYHARITVCRTRYDTFEQTK
jgi:hypothetical protein